MSAILMYHYIGDPPEGETKHRPLWVPRAEFRAQLETLKKLGLQTVSPEEYSTGLESGDLRQCVWLTFDDGALDNYKVAFPMLREAGMTATFFVIAKRSLAGETGYVDIGMMREMVAEGMSIGSHTLTHPRVARLDAEQMRAEIGDSRARLEDALGTRVSAFCYPYGNWNCAAVDTVREAGYDLAVSTIRDNRNRDRDRWTLKRAMVQPGRIGWRFRYLFSPVYHWVHHRKNRKRWKETA